MVFPLHTRQSFLVAAATILSSLIDSESMTIGSSVIEEETRWSVFREFVDPFIISRRDERDRRSAARGNYDNDLEREGNETVVVSVGNWTLNTLRNDRLIVSPKLDVRWIQDSGVRSIRNHVECDVRQGYAENHEESVAILTICSDEFYVLLKIDRSNVFYIRPTDTGRHALRRIKTLPVSDNLLEERIESIAEIFKLVRHYVDSLSRIGGTNHFKRSTSSMRRNKRDSSLCATGEAFYNLTGDTFELGNETINVEYRKDRVQENDEEFESKVEEPEIVEELAVEEDSINVGYFFDRTWERTKLPRRNNAGKESPPRWLEIGIGVDYSVIEFHGERVQQYVLALLNIVSAIYKDPSLDSNLRLVIVRMVFYAEKKDGMVRQGNARKSLENVNKWNRKLLSSTDENHHDVAVWLTRLDIGGPSGYAPVSGACDPARSCALNRDEGLTSAFIIAHEVAHILGLTHDGDETAGNSCGEEASMGSVMAPMVAATFHRFHWSTCSRKEFHRRAKHWRCLENKPIPGNTTTHLGDALIRETFTMDEQCRMEFGDGYGLCRSFELPGPCSHLWCGQVNSTQVCKTKKGPPLEGTACGRDKWCINGYCEPVDRKRFGFGPVINNPRNGGWSSWSLWGKCSRTCGIGVRFRFRYCNEPTPAFGGKYCEGKSEDLMICAEANCSIQIDLRQQQCSRLPSLVGLLEASPKFGITWLAHEPDQNHFKCRLSCRSAETGEVFVSQEFLTDGTPCTYGETDICIQGKCHRMGCDKILDSEKKVDSCGVCEGDDSTCSKHVNNYQRRIRRGMTRVSIIPRGSYNISVEVTITDILRVNSNFTFTIRDGRKRRNDLTEFDSAGRAGQAVVVEGAAFRYRKSGDRFFIWARGSTLSEIIVSLAVTESAVKRGATVGVVSRYVSDRRDMSKSDKFIWISGGWSPCSASCGGGTRHKTVGCKDVETGRIVNRKKCSLLSKPFQRFEKCNSFSCRFKWIPGPWEGCSTTCGNQGMQQRQLYCVHSSFLEESVTRDNELTVYRIMVSPSRCSNDSPPARRRECDRSPCPGNWIFTDWSSCSRSCGRGIQTRMARCVPSEENGGERYECVGSTTPDQLRSCRGHGRRDTGCEYFCRRDKSKYCSLTSLKRYCTLTGYRRRCCRSCREDTISVHRTPVNRFTDDLPRVYP